MATVVPPLSWEGEGEVTTHLDVTQSYTLVLLEELRTRKNIHNTDGGS